MKTTLDLPAELVATHMRAASEVPIFTPAEWLAQNTVALP
jgi:hypothetical protein